MRRLYIVILGIIILCALTSIGYTARNFISASTMFAENSSALSFGGHNTITVHVRFYENGAQTHQSELVGAGNNSNAGTWEIMLADNVGWGAGDCSNAAGTWLSAFVITRLNDGYRVRRVAGPSLNTWHNMTWVMVSDSDTGWVCIIDGVQQTLINCNLGGPSANNFTNNVAHCCKLGGSGGSALYFNGYIGQFAVWLDALNLNQMAQLSSNREPSSVNPPPYHWWPFYGTSSPEPNLSGNSVVANDPMNLTNNPTFVSGPPNAPGHYE